MVAVGVGKGKSRPRIPTEMAVSPDNMDICYTHRTSQTVLLAVTWVTRTSDKHSAKPVSGKALLSSAERV